MAVNLALKVILALEGSECGGKMGPVEDKGVAKARSAEAAEQILGIAPLDAEKVLNRLPVEELRLIGLIEEGDDFGKSLKPIDRTGHESALLL